MNIAILDDSELMTETVGTMICKSCQDLHIAEPDIYYFTDPQNFIEWCKCDNNTLDVCFLDIDLKNEINGIDVAKIVKQINYHTLLIFMTAFMCYLNEVVQVEPFRFLEKPIYHEDFHKVFVDVYKRIVLKISEEKECKFRFKNNGITFYAKLEDVIYVSSYKRKIIMFDTRNQYIDFYGKLDEVEVEINSLTDRFVRINKSYLFNKDYIDIIGKNSITVQGTVYQVSPKYKHNIEIIT